MQIELKSVLYIPELGFIIIETRKGQSGLWYYLVSALSSALGACVVAHLHSIEILMCSRKCWFCELWLIINKVPVCNFFRKPGNMPLRKPSTCLIPGQNFTWRILRQNTPLVTGLWVLMLWVLILNRAAGLCKSCVCVVQNICSYMAEELS